jgi:SAM-dependent methyltransferase
MQGGLLSRLMRSRQPAPKYQLGAGPTSANPEVLKFYMDLPFNYHLSAEAQAAALRAHDWVQDYRVLLPLLKTKLRVLEVGCGVGWLSLSLAMYHGAEVIAIDFNPVVIHRAREIAGLLRLDRSITFEAADLFRFTLMTPADLVVSVGVLHHTNDCHAALARAFTHFVRPGGYVFVGLYHAYGRRPFLEHFAGLKAQGASEETMFAEYRRLHPELHDETLARSWFRDQVLHPHETQHTLAELMPLLASCEMELCATSINDYRPFDDVQELIELEPTFERLGSLSLHDGKYYPGFFFMLMRRK